MHFWILRILIYFTSKNLWLLEHYFGYIDPTLVQYKSLKVIQNGGKSKKSKTFFVASPIEDLDSFYQKLFPE